MRDGRFYYAQTKTFYCKNCVIVFSTVINHNLGSINPNPSSVSLYPVGQNPHPRTIGSNKFSMILLGRPDPSRRRLPTPALPLRCLVGSIYYFMNCFNIFQAHTEKGYRVIALSYKSISMKWLKVLKIERDLVEKDLTFLGFMILQNQLKPTSEGVYPSDYDIENDKSARLLASQPSSESGCHRIYQVVTYTMCTGLSEISNIA